MESDSNDINMNAIHEEDVPENTTDTINQQQKVCRICHEESEEDRPLFHPCKCSGSIRFVHQDCLLMWLKHKGVREGERCCEVCKESYTFTKVFRNNGIMSVWDLVSAIFYRIFASIISLIIITCWVLLTPILSSIIFELCVCIASERDRNILVLLQ